MDICRATKCFSIYQTSGKSAPNSFCFFFWEMRENSRAKSWDVNSRDYHEFEEPIRAREKHYPLVWQKSNRKNVVG